MSMENAREFIRTVGESPALQERLAALTGRDAVTGLCAIAAELGFQFNPEEYREAVVEEADGGLSEEAIDEAVREWGFNETPK